MRLGILGPDGTSLLDELTPHKYKAMRKIFILMCKKLKPTQIVTTSAPWAYYIPVDVAKELDIPIKVLTPIPIELVALPGFYLAKFSDSERESEDLNNRHREFRKMTDVEGISAIRAALPYFFQYQIPLHYTAACDEMVMFPSMSSFARDMRKSWKKPKHIIPAKMLDLVTLTSSQDEWKMIEALKALSYQDFIAARQKGIIPGAVFEYLKELINEKPGDKPDDKTSDND